MLLLCVFFAKQHVAGNYLVKICENIYYSQVVYCRKILLEKITAPLKTKPRMFHIAVASTLIWTTLGILLYYIYIKDYIIYTFCCENNIKGSPTMVASVAWLPLACGRNFVSSSLFCSHKFLNKILDSWYFSTNLFSLIKTKFIHACAYNDSWIYQCKWYN